MKKKGVQRSHDRGLAAGLKKKINFDPARPVDWSIGL